MPGGDQTGPAGMGPMTGRAAGYCAGYPVPGFANPGFGRGFWGRGRGGGRGRRNWFHATGLAGWQRWGGGYPPYAGTGPYAGPAPYATPYGGPYAPAATKEQELNALKGQAEYLENVLEGIKKRISEVAEPL
ncbi:MAG: DUF5320 domain-containing protein [Sedimentisphaerales bacterium]|nr:DUF5320 domain-containing protein [Sedimentisphaerales bacterium]